MQFWSLYKSELELCTDKDRELSEEGFIRSMVCTKPKLSTDCIFIVNLYIKHICPRTLCTDVIYGFAYLYSDNEFCYSKVK